MDEWHYESAIDIDQSLVERLRRFPREPDMLVYGARSAAALALRAWLRTYHRFHIRGIDNIPANGSFVLVANHSSHLDALCLLCALPLGRLHQAFPAAAADYFFANLPRTVLAVMVVNALPFHRETHVRQSMAICRQLLANSGNILIIFPEGTRSTSGSLGVFRPGIGMLVAASQVPVVPCYLAGAHDAFPKGSWLPRPRTVSLSIGKPRSYASYPQDRESFLQICHDLREAVAALAPAAVEVGSTGNTGESDGINRNA